MKIFFKILALLLITIAVIIIAGTLWLKTDNAQITITNKLSNYTEKSLGLSIEFKNIHLSLPFKLSIDEIKITDQDGLVGNIKNLKINTVLSPSLFRQITINSLKADEINLFKNPVIRVSEIKKTDETQNNNNFFNPNIIIKTIDIAEINLDPKITGSNNAISFNLHTNINYIAQDKILNFKLLSKSLLPTHKLIDDASLKLKGLYNLKDKKINFELVEYSSDLAVITGNLLIDQQKNIIAGESVYQSSLLNKLLEKKWPDFKADIDGKLIISGNLKKPFFNISGKLVVDNLLDQNSELLPIFYVAQLNPDEHFNIFGAVNIKYDTLETNGKIAYVKNKLSLNQFVTTGNNLKSTLDLAVDLYSFLLNGRVTLQDDGLNEFAKYFPELHSGIIDVKADFSMFNDKQQLSINGKIEDLISSFGTIDLLELNLNSPDIMSKKLNDSNIFIRNLDIDSIIINELELSARSVNDEIILKTNIVSKGLRPFNFKIDGAMQLINNGDIKLNINQLIGKIDQFKIKNSKNLNLFYGNHLIFELDKIQIDNGDISLTGNITHDQVSAQGNINNISAKIFGDSLSSQFNHSLINGKINLSGIAKEPILRTNIDITNVGSTDDNKKLNLNFNIITNHNQINLKANANCANKKIAIITGTVGNTFSIFPLKFFIHNDQDLIFNADLTNQFNILSLLPEFPGQKIQGILNGHIKVTGTPAIPIIKGNLKLINGKYVYKNLGVKFKNITSDIVANGYKITFSQIKAQDTFNNHMQGNGNIDLKTMDYYFEAATTKFNPLNTPYIHGDINGKLAINGNSTGAIATGNFTLGPMEIQIPEQYKHTIPELNIVEIKEIDSLNQKKDPYELKLKINLVTNDKVFVRGWGVDTRLDGELKVSGNLNNPNVKGSLYTVKGRYQEFGKVLNIKQGVLTFDGPIMPSPYLNIVGETNIGRSVIRVILEGSIANPEIRLESTPEMPEERALSMLLFGTDTENISAFQAVQLADSARRLSGKGGSFDPLGMSKKILGIDDITLKTDSEDPEKVSIGVGKYLTDKIYFEIEQGQQADTTKTRVEIQLTPKISIENIIEQQGNTSIGINWRFDY
ncbi:MAG: hypothetical protein EKK61_03330 [Rickettsiales bacterium]|nr:MAG: hypothetical protein EKK61_03330 [Rickettsiales bacterium]